MALSKGRTRVTVASRGQTEASIGRREASIGQQEASIGRRRPAEDGEGRWRTADQQTSGH